MSGALAMSRRARPRGPVGVALYWMQQHGADLLTIAFCTFALVGTSPFPGDVEGGDTSGGSLIDRLAVFALFALALPTLIRQRHRALQVLAANWIGVAVLAWMLLSLLWAAEPGLVVRRSLFVILGYLTALAVVLAQPSPGRLLTMVLAVGVAVAAVDLASVFVVPHLAVGELGAQGMHSQKNGAGAVCLLVLILQTHALFHRQSLGRAALLLGGMLIVLAFLVLTRSKTSMGLYGLYLVFVLPVAGGLAYGRALGVALILGAALAFGLLLLFMGIQGWGLPDLFAVVFGDPTFTGRTTIWDFVGSRIDQAPILGTGYGSFWDVGAANNPLRSAPSWLRQVGEGVINQSHNGYLDLWLQIGFPGLVGGCLMLGRGIVLAARLMIAERGHVSAWTAHASAFSVLTLLVIYNLMESALLSRVHFLNHFFLLFVLMAERWWLEARHRQAAARRFGRTWP